MNAPKLKGERCQCVACNAIFARFGTFAQHRVGSPTDRRCLTEAEMIENGWRFGSDGLWRGKAMPEGRFSKRTPTNEAISPGGS